MCMQIYYGGDLMHVGDFVIRKKYKGDILFRVKAIKNDIYYLEGAYIRLEASTFKDDLLEVSFKERAYFEKINKSKEELLTSNYRFLHKHLTGHILHIDSDLEYLYKCHTLYENLGLFSICILLEKESIEEEILKLVRDYQIDIVVITGHDSYNQKGLKELENYSSTKYYLKALKKLREVYSKDDLYIFAGACGSNFEALIAYGANAASSPKRVNIDAYDPSICAIKASTTPFDKIISFDSIWSHSLTKEAGISGIESYGKMRMLR